MKQVFKQKEIRWALSFCAAYILLLLILLTGYLVRPSDESIFLMILSLPSGLVLYVFADAAWSGFAQNGLVAVLGAAQWTYVGYRLGKFFS